MKIHQLHAPRLSGSDRHFTFLQTADGGWEYSTYFLAGATLMRLDAGVRKKGFPLWLADRLDVVWPKFRVSVVD